MVNIQWIILLDSIHFDKIKIIGIKTDYFNFKTQINKIPGKNKGENFNAETIYSKTWTD